MVKDYRITLDSPDIFPGGVVTGNVSLETNHNERIKAREVRLTLFGNERVHLTRRQQGSNGKTETKHYTAERVLINQRVTVFGSPKGSGGDPVFLEPGRQYSFPFRFNLPSFCLPSCKYNDEKRISYRFDSCIDRPWKFDINCKAPLRVLPDVHVASAPPFSTELEQRLTPTACCCFGKGFLRLKIELGKAAYWWQEEIPVQVVVDNSECTSPINRLKVAVVIVSTYMAKGKVDTHTHELAVKDLPLSNGSILPHAHEARLNHVFDHYQYDERFPTSTIQGQLITHTFVVLATAKYSFGEYSIELPIFVADGPSRSSNPKQVYDGEDATDGSAPVNDPDYPDHPTEDSGQMPDDAPMYEKTEYGGGRDQYRTSL